MLGHLGRFWCHLVPSWRHRGRSCELCWCILDASGAILGHLRPGGQLAGMGGQLAGPGGQIAGMGGQIAGPGGQIAGMEGQIAGTVGQIEGTFLEP